PMRRLPMSAAVLLLAALLPTPTTAEPKPADKPPYLRLLQGDDARHADALQKRIDERQAADDYPGAIEGAEELLALRRRAQGADHHEAVSRKFYAAALRQVAALSAERRAAWRQALQGVHQARQLEQRGHNAEALPLHQKLLDACRQVLGPE